MTSFEIRDVFEDDAPILVFGGPYSNLQAIRALRTEARRLGIAADRVICTGDVVAYCADAAETVAEIRDWGCHVLAGNCERQLAAGALDCGCGFQEGTVCNLLSAGWYAHASAQVGQDARHWMASLPDGLRFRHAGRMCLALHGGVTDIARFLFERSPETDFTEELAELGPDVPDVVLAGHSGIPFVRKIGQVTWANAGVIGMPPNDGKPQTRYAVLEAGEMVLHSLDYDWHGAQKAMEAAGLTQGYHAALGTGFWPSEDALPPSMRRS